MRRSKLELYEEILNVLAEKSLTVDGIAYQCNMDCVVLDQRLNSLVKNGLVEQDFCKAKKSYSLTKRGFSIHKTLAIAKRLERLQVTVRTIDEALQALPFLSKKSQRKNQKPQ